MFEENWSSLDTAKAFQSIAIIKLLFITHIFSIQNMCAVKHIGLDLSGVIKHIDAPHWAWKSTSNWSFMNTLYRHMTCHIEIKNNRQNV